YVKTITGWPAENWTAAGEVTPLQNVPRQAPCQEAAGVVAANEPQIDHVAMRVRTALARAVQRSANRERGSIQLAAATKKRHHTLRLSQRQAVPTWGRGHVALSCQSTAHFNVISAKRPPRVVFPRWVSDGFPASHRFVFGSAGRPGGGYSRQCQAGQTGGR